MKIKKSIAGGLITIGLGAAAFMVVASMVGPVDAGKLFLVCMIVFALSFIAGWAF